MVISIIEVEYIALICGAQKAMWIIALLNKLRSNSVLMVITDNDHVKKLGQILDFIDEQSIPISNIIRCEPTQPMEANSGLYAKKKKYG
jgi:hypothetical protein